MTQVNQATPCSTLVHDGFMRWAVQDPNRVAVYDDDIAITFADLARRSRAFAAEVDRRQARRVGLCLPNSAEVFDVFFGTLMAGGCVCLFDPSWPAHLLQSLVDDHAPNILVAPQEILDRLSVKSEATLSLSTNDLETLNSSDSDGGALKSVPTAEMPFLIGFTSGSSGTPKAFIRSHQTWIESFHHSAIELGTRSDDVVLAPGPLSHGLSLYAAIEAISTGAAVVIRHQFDAEAVVRSLTSYNATMLVAVPSMLDLLLDHYGSGRQETQIDSVTRIVTAGAKLSPDLRRDLPAVFPKADVIEYYGASELSFITVAKGSENCPASSVGRAFSGVKLDVRAEDQSSAQPGHVGTIWVQSNMISNGYVGPTDGSGFRKDGAWATVGDLGHLDENGFLYLDGREGTVITSAGYTVYPSAIEAVLLSHSEVNDAVVLGLPHSRWGEVIAAAVVCKPGSNLTEEDLTNHCHDALEPYACPRQWRFIENLERTSSGKISRSNLAALFNRS